MTRSRPRDWLIGALALLLVQVGVLAVVWWTMTTPAGSDGPSGSEPGSGRPPGSATTPGSVKAPGSATTPGSVTTPGAVPAPGSATTPGSSIPPVDLTPEEVWIADLGLDAGTLVLPDSTLTDVRATGQGVRSGPDGLVADRLEVQATVPFDDIAAELGGDSRVGAAPDGQALVERTVEVLGRDLTVLATGTVEVEDGLLVVEPQSIDLGGPGVLSRATASVVRRFVTIEHAIEGLPEGLVLLEVDVRDDGFRADLEGDDVILVEGSTS